MKIVILLLVMLISAYLVIQQLQTGSDPAEENSLPYQQQINKAEDVEQLLQQGLNQRGAEFDERMERLQSEQ